MSKQTELKSSKKSEPSEKQVATDKEHDLLVQRARNSEIYAMMCEKLKYTPREVTPYSSEDEWMKGINNAVADCLKFDFSSLLTGIPQTMTQAFRYWAISHAMLDWAAECDLKHQQTPWVKLYVHIYSLSCVARRIESKYNSPIFATTLENVIQTHPFRLETYLVQGLTLESENNRLTGSLLQFLSDKSVSMKLQHLKLLVNSKLPSNIEQQKEKVVDHVTPSRMLALPQPKARPSAKSPADEGEHLLLSDGIRAPFASSRLLPIPRTKENPPVPQIKGLTPPPPRASSTSQTDRMLTRGGMSQFRTHIQTEGVSSARTARKEKKKMQMVESLKDLPWVEAQYRLRKIGKITLSANKDFAEPVAKQLPTEVRSQPQSSSEKPPSPESESTPTGQNSGLDIEIIKMYESDVIAQATPDNSMGFGSGIRTNFS